MRVVLHRKQPLLLALGTIFVLGSILLTALAPGVMYGGGFMFGG